MDLVIWLLAGAAVGWAAIALLQLNQDRGTMISMIIGATGGAIGGKMVAPMFGAAAAAPGDFSMAALVVVLATAAVCLALGNFVHNRYGV